MGEEQKNLADMTYTELDEVALEIRRKIVAELDRLMDVALTAIIEMAVISQEEIDKRFGKETKRRQVTDIAIMANLHIVTEKLNAEAHTIGTLNRLYDRLERGKTIDTHCAKCGQPLL